MGPMGFFVHNDKTKTNTDLESKIIWKNAKGIEGLNLPSAADRYTTYRNHENYSLKINWIG